MFKVIIPVNKITKKVEYFETPRYIFKQTNGVIITTDDASKAGTDGILVVGNEPLYNSLSIIIYSLYPVNSVR